MFRKNKHNILTRQKVNEGGTMAQIMRVLKAYSPRLKLGNQVSMNEIVNIIAGRIGLNRGIILRCSAK